MATRPPRITAAMCAYGRVLGEPRLSPDGTQVAFVATAMGRAQLVLVPAAGGPEVVVTAEPPPRPAMAYGGGAFDWTPDGSQLVYAAVDGGLWVAPATGGPARLLTDRGPASAPAVSPDGTRVAYVVDTRDVAVVALDPAGVWPVRVSTGADFCFDPVWSPDSSLVAWHEWNVPAMAWDASRIVVRDAVAAGAPRTVAGGDGVSVGQPRFSPRGDRLAFLCDEGGWLNVWVAGGEGLAETRRLVEDEHEHGDPSWGPGQRSFAWSPDGMAIALNRNHAGFGELVVVEVEGDTGEVTHIAKGVHGGLSWAGPYIAAVRSGARTPSQVVCIDVARGEPPIAVAHGPVAGFAAAGLAEPEAVTWPGDDGGEVHGRLYRPADDEGAPGTPPPMLVWIHGGPTGQWGVTFNQRIAYFVDRGWAVLVPDHRGSTGHGRAYTQAMAGRWGELDVADVAAGMRAAAARGWADPRRLVPIGGSAGGFTVLNLLAHHPDLCAAGVDLYGVADLLDLDETTHRFEAHYLHSVVGPLPACADRYRERSPINVAERIAVPLLILQGADDNVVPPAQSQTIADKIRATGGTVELHLYEGQGHGWNRPDIVVDELSRIEDFLRRHVLKWRQ